MANPNLTNIMIKALMITFVIGLMFGAYVTFASLNNLQIEEPYNSVFNDISGKYNDFADQAETSGSQNLVKNIFNGAINIVSGGLNVFVVGLDAIGTFFALIPLIKDVLQAISLAIPEIYALISFLSVVIAFYIGMRYIQSARGTNEAP